MSLIYASCVVVLTIAVVIAVVYLINTLKQVQRSARALEDFLLHIDDTAMHLNQSVRKVSSLISGFENSWGRPVHFIAGIFSALKKQFSKDSDGVNKEETEASHERKQSE